MTQERSKKSGGKGADPSPPSPMAVETVPIDSISPDPANARKHGARNLETVIASFRRFGQQIPILVDKSNVVRAGNCRLEAAKQLGWDTIQIVRTELTSSEAIAYAIADNRTAELAEWDDDVLAAQLNGLLAEDEELLASAGFTDEELEELLGDIDGVDPAEITEDEVPEPPVDPITKPGDLWILGRHRVLCGDSTKAEDVVRLMDGAVPFLMVTDPPYGVNLDQSWRDAALGDKAMGPGNSAKVQNDERSDWTEAWALFPGDVAYVWHADKFTDVVMQSLRNVKLEPVQQIIWNKSVMIMGRSDYHFKHEPCWYAVRKGKTHGWVGDRKQTTVIDAAPPNHIMGGSKEEKTPHPTQKPVACMADLMKNHAGDIYEPFCGSGSTLIAAEQLGRKCYGMEISPQYCDVIVKRWETLTGQKATLQAADRPASTGATP
jgi:DNA modification methylase